MTRSVIHRGRARLRGVQTDAFVVEYSRRRTLLMAILGGVFALVGLLMRLFGEGDERFWGGVCVALFGGGAVVLGMQVQRPGSIALTRAGVHAESRIAHAFAPWEAIVSVDRAQISRQEMLTVDVTDASQIETSRNVGWLKGLNQAMGMPDLAFPTSLLGRRSEVLERAIGHYIAHPEARAQIGTDAGLERLVREIGAEGGGEAARPRGDASVPTAARVLLWVGGAAGLLVSIAAALDEPDPGRQQSRLIGVLLFGTTSVAALASAWLLPRWPRLGRVLGILAAAGGLFLGWVVTQSSAELPGVLIGLAMAGAGAVVAWQLVRWSGRPLRSSRN
jgi:hypothetical protein